MSQSPRRGRPSRSPRQGAMNRGSQRGRRASPGGRPTRHELGGEQVEGRRAVIELLRAQRRKVTKVLMATDQDGSIQLDEIERLCRARKVALDLVSRSRLENVATTESHQGVVATAAPIEPVTLDSMLEANNTPFLLICDGITDPHNLGSLLRSAECAGADGIVLPRHRAARLTPTVAKVAAGAIERLDFVVVPGIPSAIDGLGKAGVEVVGLASEASTSLYDLDLGAIPVALVVGSEEKGLGSLARKRCTQLASIPLLGSLESLNASVAGAVALYEVARQRHNWR